jgi:hypothetical protein
VSARTVLAWSSGASLGLLVGWLAGYSTRDGLNLRRLSRPETPASVTVRPREPLNGSQAVEGRPSLEAALSGEIPAQRDEPCAERSPGGGLVCYQTGTHHAHTFAGTCAPDRKEDTDEGIE